jgi:hypothetical protein
MENTTVQGSEQVTDSFQDIFNGITADPGQAVVPPENAAAGETPTEISPVETPSTEVPPTEPQGTPAPPANEPDYKTLYEQEQQKVRSWNGRLSAADRKIKELEEQINKRVEAPPSAPTTEQAMVDLDDPVIKAFIAEMGDDFVKPLDLYMQKKFEVILKPITEKLAILDKIPTIERQVAETVEDKAAAHYSAIYNAHKDVAQLLETKVLDAYIDTLPYKVAVEKKRILDSGSTQEVIDFITEYKGTLQTTTPPQTNTPPIPPVDLHAATVVKHTSTFIPKGQVDPNDFMGAFNEAVNAK